MEKSNNGLLKGTQRESCEKTKRSISDDFWLRSPVILKPFLGVSPILGPLARSVLGSLARATPLFPEVIGFRAVLMFRYESSLGWLSTLRQTNHLTCLGRWGTESLMRIWYDMIWYDIIWYDMIWHYMTLYDMISHDMIWYDISDQVVRKEGVPPTKALCMNPQWDG